MATRRNRIKGIANIPQRRKVENKPSEDPSTYVEPEWKNKVATFSADANTEEIVDKSVSPELPLQEPTPNADKVNKPSDEKTETKSNTASSTLIAPNVELPRRRNFIKPIVNPKLLSHKPKLKLENVNNEEIKAECNVTLSSDISTSTNESSQMHQDLLTQQSEILPISHNVHSFKHTPNIPHESARSGSDTEYSVGPLSPTKLLNRSRIKAVPRLGQRRTSMTLHGSASESEDDGRKNYKRIRTESVCSTVSVTNEPQIRTDPGSPQKSKEFSSIIQRKCKRTEQSRKMAEARRHFLHKFGNQTPDKQKLTMIDLIFYNPTTNPMCQKPKKHPIEEIEDDEHLESTDNVEESKQSDGACIESDEENAVPAPQIKIGANGEIVVDEKSLIIENLETKRGREELQKSKVVDGDFDTGYGIYKREKRSKDWSKEETLRFYKALNTLGTDFTLMVELFSGRSRRELKMKFKKEERVNRLLIDKALTQPVQFDITELRREVVEEQKRLEEEAEQRTLKSSSSIKKPIPYYGQRRKTALKEKKVNKKEIEEIEQKPRDMYSKLEKGIASIWESDTEEETEDNSSTSFAALKPTRSGRIPKPRQPYTPKDLTLAKKKRPRNHVHEKDLQEDTFKDLSALQPGSIMIVSSQTPSGEPTFKVFMVTPTQNTIPITLTPDMLTNLTQSTEKPSIENDEIIPENNFTIAAEEECNSAISPEENNVTIPAEENIGISSEDIEQEMWPYQQENVSVAVDNNIVLLENKDVTLCSDGKYNVKLTTDSSEETILPD